MGQSMMLPHLSIFSSSGIVRVDIRKRCFHKEMRKMRGGNPIQSGVRVKGYYRKFPNRQTHRSVTRLWSNTVPGRTVYT